MMKYWIALVIIFTMDFVDASSTKSCLDEEFKQFDFWLGSWEVFDKKGKKVGESSIEKHHDNCVIAELYRATSGFSGRSINVFDQSRETWHQTWADSTGTLLFLNGEWNGQAMVLRGETLDEKGNTVQQRIKWTPKSDGSVHQQWMSSKDKGQHWESVFYGVYLKK